MIAYGAGWTDRDRQPPVGDTGRTEPRHADAKLERALTDPDPLRGTMQLVIRWAAAFLLDPDGVTRTTALGGERLARRLRDALLDDAGALREAVRALMRPALSPGLTARHVDGFGAHRGRPEQGRPRRAPWRVDTGRHGSRHVLVQGT